MTTMTDDTTMATTTPGELIQAKTICLALKFGSFGNSKGAPLALAEINADKALLSLTKRLLDSPELTAIQKFDRDVAWSIRRLAFNSLFKGGVYLIPLSMVPTTDQILKAAMESRKLLVDAAVEAYPIRVTETKARLADAADDRDYPSIERFRAAFHMEYSYITFETPTKLKAISAALFQQETLKAQARLESVAVECQQTMRAGLLSLVEHLHDRLTPDATGKQKRLHTTTITQLSEFLDIFTLKNVTDDDQLASIVAQAKDLMEGVDHTTLKSSDILRAKMLEGLESVKSALDPLIVDKANRRITFDD
jgi:hypothetical protein